jgi:pyrimidine-nucleoside phosphorylase
MNAPQIIAKKRDGFALAREEVDFLIRGFSEGSVPDYQMSAFLMAVFFRGMDLDETLGLTRAMMNSGKVLDLSKLDGVKVDKHSTGGVGDKVSIVLAPLVAAAGVRVPMVSGRTLGHTGGTLDKLESIPGLKTVLTPGEFVRNVERVGFSIAAQSKELVPADEGMYALRGVTGTVESVPLIVSSILSKKFAAGIDAIVFDVKCGLGAFMTEMSTAEELARELVRVTSLMGKTAAALITDMEQPLGNAVGNALEIKESLLCLKGKGPADMMAVTMELGVEMLRLAGVEKDLVRARESLEKLIASGAARQKFVEFVKAQGGDPRVVDKPELLPAAASVEVLVAPCDGCVKSIDARALGEICVDMGGGRRKRTDKVDASVGVVLKAKVGDAVSQGADLAEVHLSRDRSNVWVAELFSRLEKVFTFSDVPVPKRELILKRLPAQAPGAGK